MKLKENLDTIVIVFAIITGFAVSHATFATKATVAAISLKQQQQITQQRISWLEKQIVNIANQYGNPPQNAPGWIVENWNKWKNSEKRKSIESQFKDLLDGPAEYESYFLGLYPH